MTARAVSLVVLGLLSACGGKGLPEWKTNPTPSANAKRVDHLVRVSNSQIWRQSPYSRLDDAFDLPIFLIVAVDRTACITNAEDWTIAAYGDLYPCPGRWRVPRP
jgi:hypothetical protein